MNSENNDGKIAKDKPNSDSESMVTDFGKRAVHNQNFSKMVALPKTALANFCNGDIAEVSVQLVQEKGEKYIKLKPLGCKPKQKRDAK